MGPCIWKPKCLIVRSFIVAPFNRNWSIRNVATKRSSCSLISDPSNHSFWVFLTDLWTITDLLPYFLNGYCRICSNQHVSSYGAFRFILFTWMPLHDWLSALVLKPVRLLTLTYQRLLMQTLYQLVWVLFKFQCQLKSFMKCMWRIMSNVLRTVWLVGEEMFYLQ